ncbi:secreted protein [gut metagenome]|uniref:Secreted protein n=1 Tax=gut metagenome TaxID=749906 RepID=J9GUI3_9ZZZZ
MKRFYNLLSFFLLSLVGITNAVAQDYGQGALIETPDGLVGKKVLLYEPGTSDDHKAGYLNGSANWSQKITDDCVYQFIKLEKMSEDGHPLYLLQQVSTNKYVMDPAKISNAEEEPLLAYTDKKEEAFEMTVLNFRCV